VQNICAILKIAIFYCMYLLTQTVAFNPDKFSDNTKNIGTDQFVIQKFNGLKKDNKYFTF
jgi:hypothetical protein